MSNQTDHLSDTAAAGQVTSSSEHGLVASILISILSPSGPSGDWLKLFVIGGLLELMRRFLLSAWKSIINQFWITIVLEEYDDSYSKSELSLCHLVTSLMSPDPIVWMMLWLSKQAAWTQAKELSISSYWFGLGSRAVLVEGEVNDSSQRTIRFLPSHDCPASLWYRGHYIRLSRTVSSDGPFYTKELLKIKFVTPPVHMFVADADPWDTRILARDQKIVNQLLLEAKNTWKAAKEEFISIHASNTKNEWRLITSRPKRPLSSIVLDLGIKEKILDDAKDFLNSKKWYTDRGIPFRRGYLLVSRSWSHWNFFPPFVNLGCAVWGSWFWENFDNPQSRRRARAGRLHRFPLPRWPR